MRPLQELMTPFIFYQGHLTHFEKRQEGMAGKGGGRETPLEAVVMLPAVTQGKTMVPGPGGSGGEECCGKLGQCTKSPTQGLEYNQCLVKVRSLFLVI